MTVLAYGTPVRCTVVGGLPLYGRLRRAPQPCGPSLIYVRLTVDHDRGRRGASTYVLARNARPYRRGLHASGVRNWGPAWLRPWWAHW